MSRYGSRHLCLWYGQAPWKQKAHRPPEFCKAFLEKLADANVFLIATHGAGPDSEHAKIVMQSARSLASPANVIGVFICQGEFSPKVLEAAKQKNPQPVWLHDDQDAVGHPDELDLQNLGITLQVALNS